MRALLVLLVPAFLLGAVLAGDALLVHEHGEEGRHVHVVSGSAHAGHGDHSHHHGTWREGQAGEPAALAARPERADPGHGLVASEARTRGPCHRIVFPAPLRTVAASSGPVPCSPALLGSAAFDWPRLALVPASGATGPPGRASRAQGSKQRSGIAIVVAASHAIRI